MLVVLDKTTLNAQESQAEAAYAVALGNIESARVNLAKYQDDYARAETQFKSEVITVEEYSHAKKNLESCQGRLRSRCKPGLDVDGPGEPDKSQPQ